MLSTVLSVLLLSLIYFLVFSVRSQIPDQKYIAILLCRIISFSILFLTISTSCVVRAPRIHQGSKGNVKCGQLFLSVKPLLSEIRMGILF